MADAPTAFTLADLEAVIVARRASTAERSYTRMLLDKGLFHCGKKFGEEAVEFAMAAAAQDRASLRAEAADVLYHLMVALQAAEIPLQDVMDELARRTGQSGHDEKAARG